MAEKDKTITILVSTAVILILALALIGSIAGQTQLQTTTTAVTSEVKNVLPTITTGRNNTAINATIVYTLTNNPTGWKSEDCPVTTFVLKNSTGSAFTLTTDYLLTASSGTYTLVNSATALATLPVANNNTYASYNYCGEGYINQSWGRSILNLTPGLIAIAILVMVILAATQLLGNKDED